MTEKELKKFSGHNQRLAWKYFYPEGNGKSKKGYVLHHKDPSLRKENPIRYAEWRPSDLEMMSKAEHIALHLKLMWSDPLLKEKRMLAVKKGMDSLEVKARRSASMKAAIDKLGLKERISKAVSNSWTDAEIREKRLNGLNNAMKKPEVKARYSAAFKGLIWWNNGEVNKRSRECPGEGWKRGIMKK